MHDIMFMHEHIYMMNMFIMFMFYAHVFTALIEQCHAVNTCALCSVECTCS